MSKSHHLKTRKPGAVTKALPLNFLLGCSQSVLQDFQLARLAEVADLRKELHTILDRIIDVTGAAALAQWFLENDRNALKHAIENEESPVERAKRMIRDGQRSEEELLPLPSLPPGAAHLAAALRYAERNIAEGKCSVCPEPLDRNCVRYCTKHLAYQRTRKTKGQPGTADYLYGQGAEDRRGRTPSNLARLAMEREKKTRALLAELGIPPESAAVSLKAAKKPCCGQCRIQKPRHEPRRSLPGRYRSITHYGRQGAARIAFGRQDPAHRQGEKRPSLPVLLAGRRCPDSDARKEQLASRAAITFACGISGIPATKPQTRAVAPIQNRFIPQRRRKTGGTA